MYITSMYIGGGPLLHIGDHVFRAHRWLCPPRTSVAVSPAHIVDCVPCAHGWLSPPRTWVAVSPAHMGESVSRAHGALLQLATRVLKSSGVSSLSHAVGMPTISMTIHSRAKPRVTAASHA